MSDIAIRSEYVHSVNNVPHYNFTLQKRTLAVDGEKRYVGGRR